MSRFGNRDPGSGIGTQVRMKSKKKKREPPNPAYEGIFKFLSTAFWASYIMPPAPGTAGMLVGVGLWYLLARLSLIPFFHFVVLFALAAFGVFVCQKAEPYWGDAEASIMSYDMMVGVMIAGAPIVPGAFTNWERLAGVTVAIFWLLSLMRPFPIYKADELPGGFKYMADDVMAAVATLLITWGGRSMIWKSLLELG